MFELGMRPSLRYVPLRIDDDVYFVVRVVRFTLV
jgi:hypothetical protein